MPSNKLDVTVHVVLWFFNKQYGAFSCDELDGNEGGVVDQLYAEEMGWT